MKFRINDDCICCGFCADVCKAGAIRVTADDVVIDRGLCTGCGACRDFCTENGISEEP